MQFSDREIHSDRSLNLSQKFPNVLEPMNTQGKNLKIPNFLIIGEEDVEESKSLEKKSVSIHSPSRKKKYSLANRRSQRTVPKEDSPSRLVSK